MATRHHARMAVVSLLYAFDLGNGNTSEHTAEILEEKKIRNKQRDFALDLYEGVMQNLETVDKAIIEHLKDWDFERLGAIERATLRLAAYEILLVNLILLWLLMKQLRLQKRLEQSSLQNLSMVY